MKNGQSKIRMATTDAGAPGPDVEQPLQVILRTMMRHQAHALILEWAAETVGREFRGDDASPPRKRLLLPGGAKYTADPEDVLELENALRRMASDARVKLNALDQLSVLVDPANLSREPAGGPFVEAPTNEGIADADGARPRTTPGSTR